GISPFKYCGLWAVEILHSTATLSIQRVTAVCMGLGLCTISIFSCPAMATLARWASFIIFFWPVQSANPNPNTACQFNIQSTLSL
ncbi:hypothetical protein L218DRAFT_610448, partial [Marasmius fiardii PR-910]